MKNYLRESGTPSGSETYRCKFATRVSCLFLLLGVIVFGTILVPAQSADLGSEGYLITVTDADWGPMQFYVSPNGVKKVLIKQKFTLVARKPQWQLFAFRDENKQICRMTATENPIIPVQTGSTKVTRVKTVLKGLPVIKETYHFKPLVFDETETMVGQFMPSGNTAKTRVTVVANESFRLDVPGSSPALLEAAGRVFCVNPSDGIAVENRWILNDGKILPGFSLVNWKRVHIKDLDFAQPQHYQLCRSFQDFKRKFVTADMEDMAKQMDFGEPLGRPSP